MAISNKFESRTGNAGSGEAREARETVPGWVKNFFPKLRGALLGAGIVLAAEAGTAEAGTAEAGTAEAGTAEAGTAEAGTSIREVFIKMENASIFIDDNVDNQSANSEVDKTKVELKKKAEEVVSKAIAYAKKNPDVYIVLRADGISSSSSGETEGVDGNKESSAYNPNYADDRANLGKLILQQALDDATKALDDATKARIIIADSLSYQSGVEQRRGVEFVAEVGGVTVAAVDKLQGSVDKLQGSVDKLQGSVDKLQEKKSPLYAGFQVGGEGTNTGGPGFATDFLVGIRGTKGEIHASVGYLLTPDSIYTCNLTQEECDEIGVVKSFPGNVTVKVGGSLGVGKGVSLGVEAESAKHFGLAGLAEGPEGYEEVLPEAAMDKTRLLVGPYAQIGLDKTGHFSLVLLPKVGFEKASGKEQPAKLSGGGSVMLRYTF